MATVLVAEADQDLRDLVAFKLVQAGFDVIAVADGPAALSAAQEQTPQLAVVDAATPGVSGLEVCRRLRAIPATRQMMIVLTAAGDAAEAGSWAGADDYLGKPFPPAEVAARVAALRARRAPGTLS